MSKEPHLRFRHLELGVMLRLTGDRVRYAVKTLPLELRKKFPCETRQTRFTIIPRELISKPVWADQLSRMAQKWKNRWQKLNVESPDFQKIVGNNPLKETERRMWRGEGEGIRDGAGPQPRAESRQEASHAGDSGEETIGDLQLCKGGAHRSQRWKRPRYKTSYVECRA